MDETGVSQPSAAGDKKAADGEARPRASATLAARLWRLGLARQTPRLALALLAGAVYAVSAGAIPVGLEWINSAFAGGANRFAATPRDVLIYGPLLIIGLGAVNAGAHYLQTRLSAEAALRALRDLQGEMYASLTALDYAQIRADASGRMAARFTNDPTVLREALARVSRAVADLLTLIGLCAVMIYYDAVLFAVAVAIYGVVAWPIARLGAFLRKASRNAQAQAGDVASLINETVAGAHVVKAFDLEAERRRRAARAFDHRFRLLLESARLRAANEPLIFLVGSAALGAVVAVVALRVMAGAINGAQFVSFLVALLMLSQPARGLATLNAAAQEGFAAFERMLSVIDARPQVRDREDARPLVVKGGAAAFDNVSFAYGDQPALNGFSLEVPAGATVALVGESGAGKSTVIALLARLYDVDGGAVRIDGTDLREATLASVRAAVAVVGQEAFLFEGTIRDNIALGRPGADEAAIREAARAASAEAFILAAPDGYDAQVGEGGSRLSGGQRQRVALARAFLKDAPILLLDEPTAALDAETEASVQAALDRLRAGRTTIVIAHRLSTVRKADRVAVVSQGRVVEVGTHEELTACGGAYARLCALQLAPA